jgi:hypothetical protein
MRPPTADNMTAKNVRTFSSGEARRRFAQHRRRDLAYRYAVGGVFLHFSSFLVYLRYGRSLHMLLAEDHNASHMTLAVDFRRIVCRIYRRHSTTVSYLFPDFQHLSSRSTRLELSRPGPSDRACLLLLPLFFFSFFPFFYSVGNLSFFLFLKLSSIY